ncbi:hypothetical protein DZ860_23085 [Vibrio sinensis]|uniref:Transcriptional regulator VspR n=2 Tax=Vibrio sinensis TaxID=2302434 RepID=A0A3A6Q4P6_9VIBR|nr:hypothetical protein DZ860_23085 [Vibrio sinensis]
MKLPKRVGVLMHKLLIERQLNGFTVVEARDTWLSIEIEPTDINEARKKVYRQILRFEKHKWLRSEGSGRTKTYFQTELFKELFANSNELAQPDPTPLMPVNDYSVLLQERNEHKGELEIVLGEVDEFQSIIKRFPELEARLAPLHQQTKERAAFLLGKVNVLTKVINTLSKGSKSC